MQLIAYSAKQKEPSAEMLVNFRLSDKPTGATVSTGDMLTDLW